MSIVVNVNGESINYPQIGDSEWGAEATDFAVQTSSAFQKVGLSTGTTVDLPGTLDVTGNTTLDANLSVGGTTSLTGNVTLTNNLTVNGNTQLGNANTDTIGVTGIVNVDSGVLYIDPVGKVGINDTTPSEALDVNGNSAITGNQTVGGTLGVTGDVSVNTNKFNVTASSGNTTIAGTLGISNGTASAPAITPSGDTNTGLYSIGADKIGFSANGVRQGEFGVGYGGFTGNIIQVQSTTKSNTYSTTNTSYEDIPDFSCSITPRYSTSKVLVLVDIGGISANNGNVYTRLVRGSTEIYSGDGSGGVLSQIYDGGNTTGEHYFGVWHHGATYLDSPATTSVTTYKVQIKAQSGVTVYFNRNAYDSSSYNGRTASSITLMELQQ